MLLLFLLILDALLVVSFAFVPYVTRKTELFGVSVPSEHINDPQLMRLKARYRNQLLAFALVPIAATLYAGLTGDWDSPLSFGLWIASSAIYLVACFACYLPRHRDLKRIKEERGWDDATVTTPSRAVVTVSTAPAQRDFISPAWLLLFVVVIAAGLGAVALVWPQVPDPVPVHFGLDGTVDRTEPKSLMVVVPLVVVEVFLALVLTGVFFLIRKGRRQIDAAHPQTSLEQDRRFRRISSAFMIVLGVVVLACIEVLQVFTMLGAGSLELVFLPVIVLLVLICVGIGYLYFRVGQGGARLAERTTPAERNVNYDDDRYWKLGLFYVNREDPAWVVEKRFGVGWTANFARPMTWLALGALVVLIVALFVVTFLLVGG